MKKTQLTRSPAHLKFPQQTELQNQILRDLPRKECTLVFEKLTLVKLELHEVLNEAGTPIKHGYFPNTAMASILSLMTDGKSIEVGLTGKEGFVGLPLIAGFRTSSNRINTQAGGTAYRISADDLRKCLPRCPQLHRALVRYSQEAAMELSQITACNQLHKVDQRLARWLLMSHDRICSNILPLTQEFLAQMLGIRRASVSVAAALLQKAGLIQYDRGHITIQNRRGLEDACCECYASIQGQLQHWNLECKKA